MSKMKTKEQNSKIVISAELLEKVIYIPGYGYINEDNKKLKLKDVINAEYDLKIVDKNSILIFTYSRSNFKKLNEFLEIAGEKINGHKFLACVLEDED